MWADGGVRSEIGGADVRMVWQGAGRLGLWGGDQAWRTRRGAAGSHWSCPRATHRGLCHTACEAREMGRGQPERVAEPAALGAVPV